MHPEESKKAGERAGKNVLQRAAEVFGLALFRFKEIEA